jgi:RNA 2',3'-cyclic 3'-phosphodiesterase
MASIRAFIAVELSSPVKTAIAAIQSELKKSPGEVKWVIPDICHITLKFLGEVKEEQVAPIRAILDECAAGIKPFQLTVNSIGAFPTMDRPNIIWLGIKDEANILEKIARAIDEKVSALGLPKEDRPFTPHITIGRTRAGSHQALSQILKSAVTPNETFEVTALTFFQSTLASWGPTYYPHFTSPLK